MTTTPLQASNRACDPHADHQTSQCLAATLRTLANNVLFGVKEPYMIPLNKFLTENIYKVTAFLREISV
ncbi:MAG: hypothetical protein AAF085_03390, partial [Planctomycetota bacterium]